MAIKPIKPKPKSPGKLVAKAKPKVTVTKSRGSRTATQVGNDNQRETYNASRDERKKAGIFEKNKVHPTKRGKVTSTEASKYKITESPKNKAFPNDPYNKRTVRSQQRAGGKGK